MTILADDAWLDYRTLAADHLHKALKCDVSAVANDELATRHEREHRPAFARKCRDFAAMQRWQAIRHRDAAELLTAASKAERVNWPP